MRQILRDNNGATAVEYGLIVSLLVIAIIVSLNTFATKTNDMLSMVSTKVATAGN
jgi:pilus assembly protein Flp/PilA